MDRKGFFTITHQCIHNFYLSIILQSMVVLPSLPSFGNLELVFRHDNAFGFMAFGNDFFAQRNKSFTISISIV
jgi:hypothetical protein